MIDLSGKMQVNIIALEFSIEGNTTVHQGISTIYRTIDAAILQNNITIDVIQIPTVKLETGNLRLCCQRRTG